MEVSWSAQSDFVLVLHCLRSGPEWGSLRAYQLEGGAVVRQLENGDVLEAVVRSHLKKRYPKEYERGKDHLYLRISEVKALGGSKFSVRAVGNLENKYGKRGYRCAKPVRVKQILVPQERQAEPPCSPLRRVGFGRSFLEDEERAAERSCDSPPGGSLEAPSSHALSGALRRAGVFP